MRPIFLQRKHGIWCMVSLYGNSSIVLELWQVKVDRTDFSGDFKHKHSEHQHLLPDVPFSHTFLQKTWSPYWEAPIAWLGLCMYCLLCLWRFLGVELLLFVCVHGPRAGRTRYTLPPSPTSWPLPSTKTHPVTNAPQSKHQPLWPETGEGRHVKNRY